MIHISRTNAGRVSLSYLHATKVQYRDQYKSVNFCIISVAAVVPTKLKYEKAPNTIFNHRDVIRSGPQRTTS
jgi:hypothetical protein